MRKKFDETNAKIEKAFADLLAEGGVLQNITVTSLVKRAGITRGTFYVHYNNIQAVALEIENKLLNEFNFGSAHLNKPDVLRQFFAEFFAFLKENESLYRNLLRSDAALLFISRLDREIHERVLALLKEQNLWRKDLELDIYYNCDAAVQMILHHFRGELSTPLSEIKSYITEKFLHLISTPTAIA